MAKVLDACCGSKMFWFDKENEDVTYMDIREVETELSDGRMLEVKPDVVADFRDMPFEDETFHLVVFDPPHLVRGGRYELARSKVRKVRRRFVVVRLTSRFCRVHESIERKRDFGI